MHAAVSLLEELGWPLADGRGSGSARIVAGVPGCEAVVWESAADESEQARRVEALDAPPALAVFRGSDGRLHLVHPTRTPDGRTCLRRLRVDVAEPWLPPLLRWHPGGVDAARALDPVPWRRAILEALLQARRESATSPARSSRDARGLLGDAFERLFPAAPGWSRGSLRNIPVSLFEDTPEQVEFAATPHMLEHAYEVLAWRGDVRHGRQRQGSFHTPTRLVYHMLREALSAWLCDACGGSGDEAGALFGPRPDAGRIPRGRWGRLLQSLSRLQLVDPSVGPGSFLVGAGRLLLTAAAALGADAEAARKLLRSALCGVDISPLAVAVCRARLGLLAAAHGISARGVGDGVVGGNSLVDDEAFAWRRTFAARFRRHGGFDIAVGNPPYLRDSRKQDMPADLPDRYRSATSHYDLYALFMERGLDVVRPGGRISFLTSNRFLAQKYGRGIRALLLENRLESVVELNFRAFDAGVTTCITTARREPRRAGDRVLLARVEADEPLPSTTRCGPHGGIPQARLQRLPDAPFRIGLEDNDLALAERLREASVPAGELGFVTLGLVFHAPGQESRRKEHYLAPQRCGTYTTPLVDGEHVGRWRFLGNLWLQYRPDEHREPRFPELFAAHKIVCRRIIGRHRIMACPDEGGYFFSDNTVGFVPYHALAGCDARAVRARLQPQRMEQSRRFDLYYLAALLNSRLMSWYYRTLLGFNVHFYPAHLKGLPIRPAPPRTQALLARLARRAMTADAEELAAIDREIDERVERIYGLERHEVERIAAQGIY